MQIVLAIETRILRDALEAEFAVQHDVHVVARADDEMALAVLLWTLLGDEPFDADEPVAVIMTTSSEAEIPAICSRLLEEFPEVVVFGIDRATGLIHSYRMQIEVQELAGTLESLKSALRKMNPEPPSK